LRSRSVSGASVYITYDWRLSVDGCASLQRRGLVQWIGVVFQRPRGGGAVESGENLSSLPLQPQMEPPRCGPVSSAPDTKMNRQKMVARRDLSGGGSSVSCVPLRAPQRWGRCGCGATHAQADRVLTNGPNRDGHPGNGPCAVSVTHMHAGGLSERALINLGGSDKCTSMTIDFNPEAAVTHFSRSLLVASRRV
jgi:hypothetical protein